MPRTLACTGALVAAVLAGCASDPSKQSATSLETRLGPPLGVDNLPPVRMFESHIRTSVSKEGDTSENHIMDAAGDCLFVFKINRQARRMTSWRLASKNDPGDCHP